MLKKNFKIQIGNETIDGILLNEDNNSSLCQVLSIHGAGQSIKESLLKVITDPIIESNLSLVTIDFSGHGQSSGNLKEGSLKKRVEEITTTINLYCNPSDLIIFGESMGGYISLKLLEYYSVKKLILFCPAIYDATAFNVQFDQGFTEIIRKHESWKKSDAMKNLENFHGELLIVIGDKDEVIPKDVINMLDQAAKIVQKKRYIQSKIVRIK